MTARERTMIYVLGVLALGGIGYVAYTMLIRPIREQSATVRGLAGDLDDRQFQLDVDRKQNEKLKTLVPLTLPANRELAEGEYETLLGRLFRESKISGAKYVKQTQSETDPEPELVPGTPGKPGKKAYQKVNYSINFEKVTLAKLSDFLERYYRVPLMHQIVKCTIKHSVSSSAPPFKSPTGDDRNDLSVSLVTEVVMLDGAPERNTLFAVPDAFGAALGGVGLNALRNDTEKARYLTPTPNPATYPLAAAKRDYELLAARDPFHGPLPEYEPWKAPPTPPPTPAPPKPYDSSPQVYFTSIVRTVEGGTRRAQLEFKDRIYDLVYSIEMEQFGELFEMKVQRLSKQVRTDPKTNETSVEFKVERGHPRGSKMVLSDRADAVIRTFQVYGLIDNALILGESEAVVPPKAAKAKVVKGAKGAEPAPLAREDLKMAAGGGLFALKPVKEKVYRWEFGQSLGGLKPLSSKDAKAAVELAKAGLGDKESPPLPPTPVTPTREVAPFPHVPLN